MNLDVVLGRKRGEILGFTRYSLNVDEFKPQNSF